MIDHVLEKRKQTKKTIQENLIMKTERSILDRRKDQVNDYIMSKRRIMDSENSDYKINTRALSIPEDLQIDIPIFFKNFDINFLNKYISSNETHVMKYGLNTLRLYVCGENTTEKDFEYIVGGGDLINRLCFLMEYPDITVKVRIYILS
jgi:hypothetical protein